MKRVYPEAIIRYYGAILLLVSRASFMRQQNGAELGRSRWKR